MQWWTYQQLRASSAKTRLAVVEKLAQSENADSVGPLIFAVKDEDTGVRCAAARALGRFQDRRATEPLIQMLRDAVPLARAAAAEALGKLGDLQAVNWLVAMLRDNDPQVRTIAARSLEKLGWRPGTDSQRVLQILATGKRHQIAALGAEAIEPLLEMLDTGPPNKQLEAVKTLGEINEPPVVHAMLRALKKGSPAVRIAALEALEQFADPSTYAEVERLLGDSNANVRGAAVDTVARCGGAQAVPPLLCILKDSSWEVRRAAAKALGLLGGASAVEGLCGLLRDRDRDVRESAIVALGQICDARAIYLLVLSLLDPESCVRNAAANSLQNVDRHWQQAEGVRQALPEIKAALKHRDYWVRHSAAKLLEQLQVDPNAVEPAPPAALPPPPARDLPAAVPPLPADLTIGSDRDLRLAAPLNDGKMNSPKQHQILFVDDEDVFLETVRDLFVVLSNNTWRVHCAASADQALGILKTNKIELAIVDIVMPVLDGAQFLRILQRRYPDLKKAILTGNATEENRSDCLANGADLFIEKPHSSEGLKSIFVMLDELITWTPREGFQGLLRRVGLQDVIQMECLGRNSSILEVQDQQMRGRIYIENGSIIHAAAGNEAGQPALQHLLALAGGSFELLPFEPPPQRTIEGQWEFLLMEAARLRDETASQQLPANASATESTTLHPTR
ncbi:MAG: HEAT repeat domain-containing protein [Limisphaerales bacterium]